MSNILSANANKTKGRLYTEYNEESNRTSFERDRDIIINSI